MEIWISYVLRVGVLVAGAIILVGLALFIIRGAPANGPHTLDDVLGRKTTLSVSPRSIYDGLGTANPIAIIQLGVLVLILTPTMRVAMTIFLFLAQRDKVFVVITTIVFIVLILGLIGTGK